MDGSVPRHEIPEIDHLEVRREVERRLEGVGLVLATSAYSDHVGLRFSPEASIGPAFETTANRDLRSDACALLVILWARLVLQKRTVEDTHEVPSDTQTEIYADESRRKAKEYVPHVMLETISREFRSILGAKSRVKSLVSILKRHGFVRGRGERIEAGPMLELGVDGERMMAFIRRTALADILEQQAEPDSDDIEEQDDLEGRLLAFLRESGTPVAMAQITSALGERAERLRVILKGMAEDGQVRITGRRAQTRYEAVEA